RKIPVELDCYSISKP
ncbi:hypothetical protein V496_00026, partial [Pseudogymnoascus sp. VKM F-4515 (FW-2607)]